MLTSCSIQQRKYLPGCHVEWMGGKVLPHKGRLNDRQADTLLVCAATIRSKEDADIIPIENGHDAPSPSTFIHKPHSPILIAVNKDLIKALRGDTTLPRKKLNSQTNSIDKYARDSRLFGIIAITGIFYITLAAVIPAIIAIHKANIVLASKEANSDQIERARLGKLLGVMTIVVLVTVIAFVVVMFSSLLLR